MTIPEIPPEGLPLPGAERYLLRKLLGRGGFGDAYLADDTALARRVVVKLLMNLSEPTIRERFTREARIAANIHHAAVVQVHDIGALPDGRPFFVMEHIDGMSLTDFIKQRGTHLPLSHALTLLAEAAEGLAVAHRMNVIHRDIKPDNILVTKDGHAKLIDFGIAKKAVQESDISSTVKQTSVGTVLGTPRYISPEQATAKVLAGASDLYSLGCVMYALLTGRSPFEGSPQELMMHHVYTPAPTLASATPGRTFPPEIEGMVARLLAKDPLRRFQSGDDLAKALRTAAALARANEETDATAALPSLAGDPTLKDPLATGATISNVQSSSNLTPPPTPWDGATENLSQMGMSPLPAPAPSPRGPWGGEGDRTTGFDVPTGRPARKEDSLSAPMAVMEDLTGRTQPRSSGSRTMVIVGVLILVASAVGGTAFVMSRRGAPEPASSTVPTKADEKTVEPKPKADDLEPQPKGAAAPAETVTAAAQLSDTPTAAPSDTAAAAKTTAIATAAATTPKPALSPTTTAKTTGTTPAKPTPQPMGAAPPSGTTAQPKPAVTAATPPPQPTSGSAIDDRL